MNVSAVVPLLSEVPSVPAELVMSTRAAGGLLEDNHAHSTVHPAKCKIRTLWPL